jgi:hypothetical protein
MFPNVLIEHRKRIVEPIASAAHLVIQGLRLRSGAEGNVIE